MIHFLMHVFKWPMRHSIYWDLEKARATERALVQPMAYHNETRDANCIGDNMARRALKEQASITFWDGQVPEDAPGSLLQDGYK